MFNLKTTMLYLSLEFLSRKCGWLRERKWGFHCLCAIMTNWQITILNAVYPQMLLLWHFIGWQCIIYACLHKCWALEFYLAIYMGLLPCRYIKFHCGMWDTGYRILSVLSKYAQNYEIHNISLSFRCEMVTSNVSQTMTFSL